MPPGASVRSLAPGGIDLLPLPGRYLSAPADAPSVSVRIDGQATAACAALNWDGLLAGCHAYESLNPAATHAFDAGLTLERCALACGAGEQYAGIGATDGECLCLGALPDADLAREAPHGRSSGHHFRRRAGALVGLRAGRRGLAHRRAGNLGGRRRGRSRA